MSTKIQRQLQKQRAQALAALPRKEDEEYMRQALAEARLALAEGEIPVGAVVVRGGEVIARAHNTRERDGCVLGHAELGAIKLASETVGDWRLPAVCHPRAVPDVRRRGDRRAARARRIRRKGPVDGCYGQRCSTAELSSRRSARRLRRCARRRMLRTAAQLFCRAAQTQTGTVRKRTAKALTGMLYDNTG